MLEHIVGLDHVVVVVRDLERAASRWRDLGFTVSPRGTHSAHMGTGNYTIMFGDDYVELLGVLEPTPHNAPTRARVSRREGIERAAFTTTDAAEGVAALQARGIAATGPLDFGRPVDLPGGGSTQARFRTFDWPVDAQPAGLRLFACQHLTRDAVWIAQLQRHPNTATRIDRVELLTDDPAAAAAGMARLIDASATRLQDGAWRVPSGGGRADFVFLDRDTMAARYPGAAAAAPDGEGPATLALRVADIDRAREALRGVPAVDVSPARIVVPAEHACGVMLVLEQA